MAVNKPTKPSSELPKTWGGNQYPYTQQEISSGFLETVPQIIDGGKLNFEKKGIFERLEYTTAIADVINNTPIGKIPFVDSNNKFDYKVLPVIATNEEYKNGSSNTVVPSVKQIKDNVVDLSSNQTIKGNKTFTGDIKSSSLNVTGNASFGGNTSVAGLNSTGNVTVAETTITSNLTVNNKMTINGNISKNVTANVSTLPDNNMYWVAFNVDNSDESLKAYQQISYLTNGLLRNSYGLRRTVNGVNVFNTIDLGIDSSGNTSSSVITPPSNSNSTEIATTAFVKSVLSSSGNGLATFSKGTNGYYKFANGLIMQWGESQANNSKMTVTLPTAFTSGDSYQVFTQYIDGNQSANNTYIENQTATSFQWDRYGGIAKFKVSWFAIGY